MEVGAAEVIAAVALIIAAVSAWFAHGAMKAAQDSAQAAATSAQADTTLARLAEAEHAGRLAPDLHLSFKAVVEGQYQWQVAVQNVGPQNLDSVDVHILRNSAGELPPACFIIMTGPDYNDFVEAHQTNLGSLPHDQRVWFELAVTAEDWHDPVELEFLLLYPGDSTPAVLRRSLRFR